MMKLLRGGPVRVYTCIEWPCRAPFHSTRRRQLLSITPNVSKLNVEVEESTPVGLISETPSTSYSPTPSQPSEPPSTVVGYASLFAVALLWGSYAPSLRFLFESPMPPSAGLVNFLQAFIASLFLALSAVTQQKESNAETNAAGTPLGQSKLDSSDELWVVSISESQKFVEAPESRRMPRNALEKLVSDALYWRSESVLSAGAELGVWMCLAFGLELYALEVVPATRASFIMQAQVIVTPILVWLSRVR